MKPRSKDRAKNTPGVIIIEGHVQGLANAIAYLIQNPIDAERIANNGYNWALNNLDYKNNAAKLLSFIDKT